uniref:Uncharacterized protein n=1 Tax=Anguilla anguilla TaxID=7936 RepID=A0A0E9RSA4_ANGAN
MFCINVSSESIMHHAGEFKSRQYNDLNKTFSILPLDGSRVLFRLIGLQSLHVGDVKSCGVGCL